MSFFQFLLFSHNAFVDEREIIVFPKTILNLSTVLTLAPTKCNHGKTYLNYGTHRIQIKQDRTLLHLYITSIRKHQYPYGIQ